VHAFRRLYRLARGVAVLQAEEGDARQTCKGNAVGQCEGAKQPVRVRPAVGPDQPDFQSVPGFEQRLPMGCGGGIRIARFPWLRRVE
jgi:hypothetical protein